MVHLIKIALFASVAILPALAAPLNADELIAREPAPRRPNVRNIANRVNSVVSTVGSVANRVGSAVSSISRLFDRELDSDEELVLRDLLEEFHAREPAPRANIRRTANRVNSVISRVGSTARRVGSVVSSISSLFGRDLDSDEELVLRDVLEEFHAREPAPSPRANIRRTAGRINSVISRVGSTARRVGSVVSSISSLFGRELNSDEELVLRELLEEFHAREPESAFDERELDDVEAREVFDEELD
jgi:predicted component of type VI protein secretion system